MEDKSINEKKIDETVSHCKKMLDDSYYKYGEARKNYWEGQLDALGSLDNCLIKFNKTKNTEYLHDAINYLLLRMLFPLPVDYYDATDLNESAGVVGTPINIE